MQTEYKKGFKTLFIYKRTYWKNTLSNFEPASILVPASMQCYLYLKIKKNNQTPMYGFRGQKLVLVSEKFNSNYVIRALRTPYCLLRDYLAWKYFKHLKYFGMSITKCKIAYRYFQLLHRPQEWSALDS